MAVAARVVVVRSATCGLWQVAVAVCVREGEHSFVPIGVRQVCACAQYSPRWAYSLTGAASVVLSAVRVRAGRGGVTSLRTFEVALVVKSMNAGCALVTTTVVALALALVTMAVAAAAGGGHEVGNHDGGVVVLVRADLRLVCSGKADMRTIAKRLGP